MKKTLSQNYVEYLIIGLNELGGKGTIRKVMREMHDTNHNKEFEQAAATAMQYHIIDKVNKEYIKKKVFTLNYNNSVVKATLTPLETSCGQRVYNKWKQKAKTGLSPEDMLSIGIDIFSDKEQANVLGRATMPEYLYRMIEYMKKIGFNKEETQKILTESMNKTYAIKSKKQA